MKYHQQLPALLLWIIPEPPQSSHVVNIIISSFNSVIFSAGSRNTGVKGNTKHVARNTQDFVTQTIHILSSDALIVLQRNIYINGCFNALWDSNPNKMCWRPPQYAPAPVTLIFDLLILKVVPESRVTCATSVPILNFLGLSVLDLLGVYTFRSSDRPVGPTQATFDCLSDQSDRPVAQTVAEPPHLSITSMWPAS